MSRKSSWWLRPQRKGASNRAALNESKFFMERNKVLRERIKELADENAKLRELARRFGEHVSQDRCEGCVMKRRCNNGDIEECWQLTEIRALAKDLGIEVPDGS